MNNRSIVKPTIVITVLRFVSFVFGLGTFMLMAKHFGTSDARSAYFAALIIPTFVITSFLSQLNIIFVPVLIESEKKGEGNVWKLISNVLALMAVILLIAAVLIFVFSDVLANRLCPKFSPETRHTYVSLLRILVVSIVLSGINGLLGSIYFAQHRFIRPVFFDMMLPLINILFLLLLAKHIGIYSIAWGFLTGILVKLVALLPILKGKFIFPSRFIDRETWKFIKLCLPLIAASLLMQIAPVIENSVASTLSTRTVSYIGYARKLIVTLFAISASGLAVTITPALSRHWSEDNRERLKRTFTKGCVVMALFSAFVVTVIFSCRFDIIRILCRRGAFTESDVTHVANVLALFLPYLVLANLGNIVGRGLYVAHTTRKVLLMTFIMLSVYIVSLMTLVPLWGRSGLVISISVSFFTLISGQFIFATRYMKAIDVKYFWFSCLKIVLVSLVSYFMFYLSRLVVTVRNPYIGVPVYSGVIAVVFFVLSVYVFRMRETVKHEI